MNSTKINWLVFALGTIISLVFFNFNLISVFSLLFAGFCLSNLLAHYFPETVTRWLMPISIILCAVAFNFIILPATGLIVGTFAFKLAKTIILLAFTTSLTHLYKLREIVMKKK